MQIGNRRCRGFVDFLDFLDFLDDDDDDDDLGAAAGWAEVVGGSDPWGTGVLAVPTNRSLTARRNPRGRYKTTKQIVGQKYPAICRLRRLRVG